MGKTTEVYWTGTYLMKDDTEAEFRAYGTYYYSPGCMYRRNGDPGDPPEEETDVSRVDITCVTDSEGNDITDKLTKEQYKEIEDGIREEIEDGKYQMEYEYPDPPEED